MKRHTFALTILLASLAGPLVTVGSARCQSGAPNYRNQCEVCPLLEDRCNDYLYYCEPAIASAQYDNELLDPRFDPDTGRYIGHDEVNPIIPTVETAGTDAELDAFYAECEGNCNAEVKQAYTSETTIAETVSDAEIADADRYNEEYYDEYGYDYDDYNYDYEAEDYWYEESATEEVTATEATEAEAAVSDETAEQSYQDSYDYDYEYDYGYDNADNYDYEYETYDYEAYDYEADVTAADTEVEEELAIPEPPAMVSDDPLLPEGPEVRDYEAEVAAQFLAAEQAALAAAEQARLENSVAADAWDYEAEGYDPYEYDYEAYQYEYEVYENSAVATPVEEVEEEVTVDAEETVQLTSEHEADFADTWTDGIDADDMYSYEYDYDYEYDYNYGVDYEVQPEAETAESVNVVAPVATAVSRHALLSAANLLDSLSQVLKNASVGLERTASLDSNIR